jgi:hypothetical protein
MMKAIKMIGQMTRERIATGIRMIEKTVKRNTPQITQRINVKVLRLPPPGRRSRPRGVAGEA